jgi:very-short-patch-repair endonuclease
VPSSHRRRRRGELRRLSLAARTALWFHLRGRRLAGFEFRRHHLCGPFVLDFFCSRRQLAIELVRDRRARDPRRDRLLAARGITVLRFPCDQVFRETEAVLTAIAFALATARPAPSRARVSRTA